MLISEGRAELFLKSIASRYVCDLPVARSGRVDSGSVVYSIDFGNVFLLIVTEGGVATSLVHTPMDRVGGDKDFPVHVT